MQSRFLGLDLAWINEKNPSGFCVLEGDANSVALVSSPLALTCEDGIHREIEACTADDIDAVVLAIDAPLIISNLAGQRPCETDIGRRYGHAHASAHTSNLTRFPEARGARIARALCQRGWSHGVGADWVRTAPGRWLMEVYPHPAHVTLFNLPKIISYKRGNKGQKLAGVQRLREEIRANLCVAAPRLVDNQALQIFLGEDLTSKSITGLKAYEDKLDALLCAYIAAHYWAWSEERNAVIGCLESGYIVVPTHTSGGGDWEHSRDRRASRAKGLF